MRNLSTARGLGPDDKGPPSFQALLGDEGAEGERLKTDATRIRLPRRAAGEESKPDEMPEYSKTQHRPRPTRSWPRLRVSRGPHRRKGRGTRWSVTDDALAPSVESEKKLPYD